MDMGFAPTWLRQVSPPPIHKTTLTTDQTYRARLKVPTPYNLLLITYRRFKLILYDFVERLSSFIRI